MGQCVDKDVTIEQHDEKTSTSFILLRIFFFVSLKTDDTYIQMFISALFLYLESGVKTKDTNQTSSSNKTNGTSKKILISFFLNEPI
jgi:hypothetical protein